ncbi:MAG: alpha-glucosidase C-terminal domain-containing protein [Chloroflexi bacterium]|nr:alpha-glucosidase C-terminal domain-containing protein [Chloroflexota bacterium]
MLDSDWIAHESRRSLARLLPRLARQFSGETDSDSWAAFTRRLEANFAPLFNFLYQLYGHHYDFFYHLETILATVAKMWLARPAELKALDAARENDPRWFQSNRMLGGVCYVDLFAGNLDGVRQKIPYFKELGLTYLHLMPLFRCPEGNNDGGYAVSSYREVNPILGDMTQLRQLAAELRQDGISLALDFIFNHTSDEHEWALRAGDAEHQNYYLIFPDRRQPDAYETHLREIFPDEHPGAFSPLPRLAGEGPGVGAGGWVWTTFHTFQWDLNYANPALFTAMAEEMLFIANVGVEVLRLDAVAFIWKRLGTSCENLPEAHLLIQAFNTLARIAAPAMLFKSEAIVHPDEVAKYIRPDECQLSYNPLLMALLWNSLATRKVRLLSQAMRERFAIHPDCAWVNYVRVHDDIGWTFSDEDAAQLGVKGYDHRQFLNSFFTGRFPGSFARGLPFQENPKTGDMRISGTCASLAGLEAALQSEAAEPLDQAVCRILLLHSVILSLGGIPLIYLGDEVGQLNDYSYRDDPAKADDSRWVHRPRANWQNIARRNDPQTVEGKVYMGLRRLIELRQKHEAFAGGGMKVLDTGNDHVFGYSRSGGRGRITALANFSEHEQYLNADQARRLGLEKTSTDLVAGEAVSPTQGLTLKPYQFVWLAE